MNSPSLVARRQLLYTSRDHSTPQPCAVGITTPRDVTRSGADDAELLDPLSTCEIVFEGLPVPPIPVHGADSLQALAMACDEVDGSLRGLERKQGYEFFWDDGSAYFAASV